LRTKASECASSICCGKITTSEPTTVALVKQVIAFGYLTKLFLDELIKLKEKDQSVIAHFHEWMAGLPILDIKRDRMPVKRFSPPMLPIGETPRYQFSLILCPPSFFQMGRGAKNSAWKQRPPSNMAVRQKCDVFTTVSEVRPRMQIFTATQSDVVGAERLEYRTV